MADEVELSDEELGLGGFRYEDLEALRVVENRTDLQRKQTELGFPLPVKTGKSQALFLKAEVFAWLRMRAALRNAPTHTNPPSLPDAPIKGVPPPHKARSNKPDHKRAVKAAKG
jgi:hypothetical protein